MSNTEVLLASRPNGAPTSANFDVKNGDRPTPGAGEVLLRLIYLSVDPYLRGRMNDVKSYIPPFAIGAPLDSGCVAEVVESNNDKFAVGDVVTDRLLWSEYQVHSGKTLTKLDPSVAPLSYFLGVLGMPGMTAWAGLNIHGRPVEGETIVVSAATGAVGSLVCQLAKLKGLRVVGVAGGAEKCAYAVENLGCDACVDHRDPELNRKLKEACPKGVDIYFENVGGVTLDAVLPLMNPFSRIPLCGMISQYNATEAAPGPDKSGIMWRAMLVNRISVRGFIVTDHWDDYMKFLGEVAPLIKAGKINVKESVSEGLATAPDAFIGLLSGANFGKQIVKVGAESSGG